MSGDIERAVRGNALATYLGLVEHIEGASLTKPLGFNLVRGPGTFSFCNFAIGFDLEDEQVDAAIDVLLDSARDCSGFCAFSSSCDTPSGFDKRLFDAGFRSRQSLTCLASNAVQVGERVDLIEHSDLSERLAISRFMVSQFFEWMSSDAREAISLSTAMSRHRLLSVGGSTNPVGAVMLVQAEGVFGLYNLCVQVESQGQGLGSRIVRSVQQIASNIHSPVAVLCEPGLVSWYQCQLFEPVGSIEVYCCDA